MPAVLAPLIVRKPGAALFAEMVAAGVSALLGSQWGADTLLSGFVQGAAAELVFAFVGYQRWSFAGPGHRGARHPRPARGSTTGSCITPSFDLELQLVRGVVMAISASVFVAVGSLLLERSLRRAGVLEGFAA